MILRNCGNITMQATGSILIFSLRVLRQPSKDIIWRGKSAGQTWTAFFGSMGFCKRNLSGNGRRLSMENPVEQINNIANMDDFLKTVGKTSIP